MAACKICPACGHRNSLTTLMCGECGMDLAFVPVTREPEPAAAPPAAPASGGGVGRKCSMCGTVSPIMTRECPQCGNSLSASAIVQIQGQTPPAPEPKAQKRGSWKLLSSDRRFSRTLSEGGSLTLGKEGDFSEYLCQFPLVSRRHASLTVRGGKLYIRDEGSTNGIQINWKLYITRERECLFAGYGLQYTPINRDQELEVPDRACISLGGHTAQPQDGAAYLYTEYQE